MIEDMSFGANAIFSEIAIQQVVASGALLDQSDAVAKVLAIRDGTITAGTRVSTLRGALRAHDLRPGDKVLTRDNGYQTISHLHRDYLSTTQLLARQDLWPVRIAPKVLNGLVLDKPLVVAASLHLLLCTSRAQTLFGQAEVLIPALHMTDLPGVRRILPKAGVQLVTLALKRQEIFVADGVWIASTSTGPGQDKGQGACPARRVLDPDQTRRLFN